MSSTGTLPSDVAPWIERLARLGYAAKALLYGTIGLLAARAAFGARGRVTDTQGALRTVEGMSLHTLAGVGRWPFAAVAIGLVAYGVYELLNARYRRIEVAGP